ncbi:MAG: DUF2325 domain-containing protein, partial [Sphingomonadaceae bacterium]
AVMTRLTNELNATLADNTRLTHELDKARQRINAMLAEKTASDRQHATQLMQQRAQLVGKDSLVDSLRAQLTQLQDAIPGLESRQRLAARLAQMDDRERELRHQINALRLALADAADTADTAAVVPQAPVPCVTQHVMHLTPRLQQRAVLCVGGRGGNVASYRALIEREGARFSHHDGGLEDNANRLDASLAAADLVICQTGCISHSAYWRVKDYCKRHGKRCVFLDNPSTSSLARGLQEVVGS